MTTYIVTGYMRSGTSMMMAALEAGGLKAVRSDERDKMNKVFGDEHYLPNPNGFYELPFSEVEQIGFPQAYEGQLLKVMYSHVVRLTVMDYKVIFMKRDPEEIRQSYEAFFNAKAPGISQYDLMIDHVISLLKNRKDMDVTVLNYKDVIENPTTVFNSLKERGWDIEVDAAANVVDPELYRFRKENLVTGI